MNKLVLLVAAVLFLPFPALAGKSSHSVSIAVTSGLIMVVTPPAPTIGCDKPPGTVVAKISTIGGSGKPMTMSMTGDTADFSLSGKVPPANLMVAPGGILPASCGTKQNVSIVITQ